MAWMMPAVRAPRTPSGWPMATTIEPTLSASASASTAAGIPVPATRSRARSASASRATIAPSEQRPSTRRTAARDRRATWALVTTQPRGHSTPDPRDSLASVTSTVTRRRCSARLVRSTMVRQDRAGARRPSSVGSAALRRESPTRSYSPTWSGRTRFEIRGLLDAGAPERQNDVADQETRPRRRAVRLHVDHDHGRLLVQVQPLAKCLG